MMSKNRIDEFRKRKMMSYQDIATKCGVTAQYVQQLAKGKKRNPSLEIALKISQALGESMEKVFSTKDCNKSL